MKLLMITLVSSLGYANNQCEHGVRICEWESWGQWSLCTTTCAGLRTRRRDMCCGSQVHDCLDTCHRPNTSVETEPCETHCPNGGSYIDGICHCPPLRYGICCERSETNSGGNCSRHCTWTNWRSWGACNTGCGCGDRLRTRRICCWKNTTESCAEECNMDQTVNKRTCTAPCSSFTTPCKLCAWNDWHPWTSCSHECGEGQRSRSRTPCCCSGHENIGHCLFDCGLSASDTLEMTSCGEICHNQGIVIDGNCSCPEGFLGSCCQNEVTEGNCTKCSLHTWASWGPCSQTCGGGHRTRTRGPCCRIGQDVVECTEQCSLDENLLTEREDCNEMCCREHMEVYILITGVGSAIWAIAITSLIWGFCFRWIRQRKTLEHNNERPTRTTSITGASSQCQSYPNPSFNRRMGNTGENYYESLNLQTETQRTL